MSLTTKLAIGTTVILWASAFAGIRAGLHDYSPEHLAAFRFLIASAVLALAALFQPMRRPDWADLPRFFAVGFMGIPAYNIALNMGEVTVSAGAASFIINTAPIFTALFAMRFLNERIYLMGWVGMLLSFIGVGLIAFGGELGLEFTPGALLILLAALCQSLYFVLQKPLLKKYTSFQVVSIAMWLGTACLLIFLPGLSTTIQQADSAATLAVIYLGIFPAALAFFTWSYALSSITASGATTFLYLVPVVSIIIAYIWLGEVLNWLTLIGGGFALIGVILVNTLGRRQLQLRRSAQSDAAV